MPSDTQIKHMLLGCEVNDAYLTLNGAFDAVTTG
jgi:hypothetical protein